MIRATVTQNPRIRSIQDIASVDGLFMRTCLVKVDQKFRDNESKLFTSEGSSGGSRWRALSPEYARRKAGMRRRDLVESKRFKTAGLHRRPAIAGRTILVLGGGLRESLRSPSNPDHIAQVEGRTLVVGTSYELANRHFEGGPNLPRRNPIQHTAGQKLAYLGIVRDEFVKRGQAIVRSIARSGTARGVRR